MNITDALPGTLVTINTSRDHWMDANNHQYMSYQHSSRGHALHIFEIVKVTKGGLIEVQVSPKHHETFAPYNVDIWDETSQENRFRVLNHFYDLFIKLLQRE